jgi:bifunctional non-homologous end joining protein LigD
MPVPFSPRGLPGAPVSMPLAWNDLARGYPSDYRIDTALARVRKRGDAWADVPRDKQDIMARFGSGR